MAMGYVFGKISDLNISLPKSGLYVFLKASDIPIGRFYNEHRDRRALYAPDEQLNSGTCLDRNGAAVFDDGWYEPNLLPPVARWMGKEARISFQAKELSQLSFDLTSHMPDVREHPLLLEFFINNELLSSCNLIRNGWLHVDLAMSPALSA